MGVEGKMNKLAIISDIHGCYETLLALIAKIPPDHQIVFAGDLIDRGPRSKEVVEYAMNNKIPTVMGNHEHMMLFHYGRAKGYNHPRIWMSNGGIWTTESYCGRVPHDVLKWAEKLPLCLIYDDVLVSHTGHGGPVIQSEMHALWERSKNFKEGFYRVFGHTQEEEAVITDSWAMIDTGAAYKAHGYGKLTAFLWPSKEVIQQEYCDTPQKSDEDL